MKVNFYATALSVLVIAFGLGTAQAQTVDPQELLGKTWNFKQGKITGKVTYKTSKVKAQFGGKTYNGTLRIKGKQICTAYKQLRKGKEDCFSFTKTKSGYKNSNGATIWR
ncbi:hypothetical protein [Roseibium sp.]|uniref:hypothetical protein n=1 Tax=Roseibium sp. TaxID=1936156 RepID=UPI003D0BAEDB